MTPRRVPAGHALAWAVLFFVCVQAAVLGVRETSASLRDREYGVKLARLRARLKQEPGRPLVLLLGSSRCLLGFRPAALPPCHAPDGRPPVVFNCGFLGAGPLMELICLRRLLADGVRPDLVVVECWPPAETAEGLFRPSVQRLGRDDLRVWYRHTGDGRVGREWAESRVLPCYSARREILQAVAPGLLPPSPEDFTNVDETGWKPCPFGLTEHDRQRRARWTRTTYEAFLQVYRHRPAAEQELRELLGLCRQEGARAALVFLPEGTDFRSWYSPAARADVADFLGRLSRDCDVPLVDARTWVADAGFADGYHLLPEGAAAFTARFGRDALQPLLEGRPPARGGEGP